MPERQDEARASIRGQGTIMVVDDEPLVMSTVTDILKVSGYDPLQFGDSAEAVAFYRKNWRSIDFVLLDMMMPGLDGKACFREMKLINPDVKAMLMTGYSDDEKAAAAISEGMLGYIAKPFQVDSLLGLIKKGIGDGK
jgi:DNA-binding NtrC family response regulator